jgi:hypothetical protein
MLGVEEEYTIDVKLSGLGRSGRVALPFNSVATDPLNSNEALRSPPV